MLSSTTKYALKTLSHLKQCRHKNYTSVDDLASELKIPRQYLAKIMKTLAVKGFAQSKKGPNGGIRLPFTKKEKKTLLDLCVALDDPVSNQLCFLDRKGCDAKHSCIFHARWGKLRNQIRLFLSSIQVS